MDTDEFLSKSEQVKKLKYCKMAHSMTFNHRVFSMEPKFFFIGFESECQREKINKKKSRKF